MRVTLKESLYGYPAGASGVIVSSRNSLPGSVLVRFDETGHMMFVATSALSTV
jgi:hypothetical protein